MSWSKTYSSQEQMDGDSELPDNATQAQFDATKAAVKIILDSGIIPVLEKDPKHEEHPDNIDGEGNVKAPQAQVRISIGGHNGKIPSLFVSVSGA